MKYNQWRTLPINQIGSLALSLLAARGIDESGVRLHDPFLLPDMRKAAERIERAAAAREIIAVYGDYDVDGVTSACIVTDYLRSRGAECLHYIPDRLTLGYGLHTEALRELRGQGATLVITVDVGVTAFEAADAAAEMGLDLIITDHHNCRDELPNALAVINPKRADSEYPFKELSGAGVALKLICALGGDSGKYIGLAALGTVADIVPLVGENRFIAKHGLETIGEHPGIAALLAIHGMDGKPVTAKTVSYTIAPMLNAAGRMQSADIALELLQDGDTARKKYLASVLNDLNNQRKEIEADMLRQAHEMCAGMGDAPAIVLAREGWHPGITGILAAKLTDYYKKPVFLGAYAGDIVKGTARCPKGMDLTELLEQCSDTLIGYGGHTAAAGFTVEPGRVEEFAAAVTEAAGRVSRQPADALIIDAIVAPHEINRSNAEEIAAMGPFGEGNPEPILRLNGAVIDRIIPLKEGKHLRMNITAGTRPLSVLGLGFPVRGFPYSQGDVVDLAFRMGLNDYRGEVSVQMELVDIR
ncbi:MAG: single-stranded-DNA-specific exonuclease RecJ [Oscillospiraceae bacterium]|nr:single-stranded-DNA-specific exonuclease RecJ [Oscillospiraceae bacterium]